MGNCQAVDAAALVIQHPSGKLERMYWPVPASEIMKMNPGHYVSLIIPMDPIPLSHEQNSTIVKFTRVKLLRPCDTLILGHAYRLITSQEVMKVLRAKKQGKMKSQQESVNDHLEADTADKVTMRKKQQQQQRPNRQRTGGKSWRPSLRSITESPS